jgi:hypothetical protein
MNYSVRLVTIVINQRLINKGNKLFVHFVFGTDKDTRYLLDKRFSLYDKFEEKISDLEIPGSVEFVRRRNEKDRVVLEYEKKNEEKFCISGKFFTIADFVPPYPGCSYCIYKGEEKNYFFECKIKNKTMSEEKENCAFFKEKQLYKT